jgi:hypothetical protein
MMVKNKKAQFCSISNSFIASNQLLVTITNLIIPLLIISENLNIF